MMMLKAIQNEFYYMVLIFNFSNLMSSYQGQIVKKVEREIEKRKEKVRVTIESTWRDFS